jgi:mercuric reductase
VAFHLVILGGGSAAIAAARAACARGARVTLVNEGLPLGGTCLHVGCVPSKFLIRAGEAMRHAGHARYPGIRPKGADLDYAALAAANRGLVDTLRETNYGEALSKTEGLTLIRGWGRLADGRTVDVDGQTIRGDAILVATGSSTAFPDLPGLESVPVLTNENLFALDRLPASVVVLGGGYIALETAQWLARLGSQVTLLQRGPHVLSKLAPDLGGQLADFLRAEGLAVHTEAAITQVRRQGTGVAVDFQVQGQPRHAIAERVFVSLGRKGNTEGLGLAEAGVDTQGHGFVKVDRHLQSSCPGVYAAGDVLGGHMFVYSASHEAEVAVGNLLGDPPREPDLDALPWVVFTDPQVAGTGLDLDEALEKGFDAESATLPVARWPRFRVAREERGFLRLVRDRKTDTLLGARALCPEGGDLMTELRLILRHRIPLREIADTPYPYLTLGEGIQRCAAKFHA